MQLLNFFGLEIVWGDVRSKSTALKCRSALTNRRAFVATNRSTVILCVESLVRSTQLSLRNFYSRHQTNPIDQFRGLTPELIVGSLRWRRVARVFDPQAPVDSVDGNLPGSSEFVASAPERRDCRERDA